MSDTRIFNTSKNIALVAHDNKKTDFISWAETNKAVLAKHKLIATGTTGKLLEEKLNLPEKKTIQRAFRRRPTGRLDDSGREYRYDRFLLGSDGSTTSRPATLKHYCGLQWPGISLWPATAQLLILF